MVKVERLIAIIDENDKIKNPEEAPEYVMSHTSKGLRFRLTAVGGYADVVALSREEGVQHRHGAESARSQVKATL